MNHRLIIAPFQEKIKRERLRGKVSPLFEPGWHFYSPTILSFAHFSPFHSAVYPLNSPKFIAPTLRTVFSVSLFTILAYFSQVSNFDNMARAQSRVRASKLAQLVNTKDNMAQFRELYHVPPSISLTYCHLDNLPVINNNEILLPIMAVMEGDIRFLLHSLLIDFL